MSGFVAHLTAFLFIAAGLFGTGALLGRIIPSPAPLLTSFIGSALVLFLLVLGCDAAFVPLRAPALITALGVVVVLLVLLAWRLPMRRAAATEAAVAHDPRGARWIWAIPIAVGFASVVARAVIDPLSGWDNDFRWDNLSQLLLTHGSLHFYPPVTAADFRLYPWCDGIPPLVSILDFWLYLAAHTSKATVTAIRVCTEFALLAFAVRGYARTLWRDAAAGWAAVAALASSSILLWGVAMGQETGLTALSLVTTLWFLELHHLRPSDGTAIWSGAAASLGALSREYGLAFIALGAAILVFRRAHRRARVLYVATATMLVAPWYLRNAWITGNPLYNQDLLGWFPTNPVQSSYMRDVAAYWSPFRDHGFGLSALALTVLALAGPVLCAGVAGAVKQRAASVPIAAGIVLVAALWLWSVAQTAGGWTYSLRVLTPALALASVLAGWLGTSRSRRWQVIAAVVALPLCCDAARRAWHLPGTPFVSPASVSFETWRAWHGLAKMTRPDPVAANLVRDAAGESIITDHPLTHRYVLEAGGHPIPWWSPEAAPIFDARLPFDQVISVLRDRHVRFIAVYADVPVNRDFVAQHRFLRELRQSHRPVTEINQMLVYDLKRLATGRTAAAGEKSFRPVVGNVPSPLPAQ